MISLLIFLLIYCSASRNSKLACMPCWAMHMLPRVHAVLIHNVLVEASNYSILHYTIIRLAEVHRWMKYMKMISEL